MSRTSRKVRSMAEDCKTQPDRPADCHCKPARRKRWRHHRSHHRHSRWRLVFIVVGLAWLAWLIKSLLRLCNSPTAIEVVPTMAPSPLGLSSARPADLQPAISHGSWHRGDLG